MDSELITEEGRVGFVTILGRPNVGKSTFLNKSLGYHLTAVSTRPNTTRKKWLGILSDDDSQIVFVDTPGVHLSRNKMHEAMADTIKGSISDSDQMLCICDPTREFGDEDKMVAEAVKASGKSALLLVNKIDVARPDQIDAMKTAYQEIVGEVPCFEISSITGQHVPELLADLKERLPLGPFMFPKDQVSDVIERDIAEEIIRESANELVYQEVPQSLAVKIDTWNENEKKIRIAATVYIERESQKAIVIGEKGAMINQIAKTAREKLRVDLEKFIDVKLRVKVVKDWQNRKRFLREMSVIDY